MAAAIHHSVAMNAVHVTAGSDEQKHASCKRFRRESTHNPAAGMRIRQLSAVACALGLGVMLGSCGAFSDTVADYWPHFAGGEPAGVPPRPGEPGYNKFIAHGQPTQSAASPAFSAQPSATAPIASPSANGISQTPTAYAVPQNPEVNKQSPPAVERPPDNSNAVQGGLY
jgi:hypothetical protein